MADDLGSQLSVQQQINKVLQKRNGLLAQQAKMLGAQIQLATEYCKALDCADLDGMNDRLGEINASLQQVGEDASTSTDQTSQLSEAARKSSDNFKELAKNAKTFAMVAIGFKAIKAGLGGIVQTVTNIGSALGSAIGSVMKFGRSLISLPFTLMGNLIGMAQGGGGGGGNPLKEALEEVRKEMGSLASNEGKIVGESFKQFKAQASDLAGTGLKMSQVYGRGKKGLAEALKGTMETMKGLGAQSSFFAGELKKNAVAVDMFRKGLGLSHEDMASVANTARASGQSMTGTLNSIANYSIQLGEKFGISSKLIAKDMGAMMKDYEHFGHLGPKVMAQNAVYARKLGIEIKSLTGMIDKFDNFEDAAKGAAQLSQAFGMNVDAMKMMKEQDPAKRLRMLQDAFQATGRSVKDMTMQEKKLLAQQAGFDDVSVVDKAFSQQGLGQSYDDIMNAGDDAKKKTLSQAEAMGKLADSIDRITKSGGGGGSAFKSFFDAFTQGFGDGIMKHKEFKKVLSNIKESLKIVNTAGKAVGKMFVDEFPGVKKMMIGLQKLFDPERFRNFMEDVKLLFGQFFKDVKDGKDGVPGFIEGLKTAFGKFFGAGKEGATMFKEGFMQFIKAAGKVFAGILRYVIPQLTKGIKKLTEWIKKGGFKKLKDDGTKTLGEVFGEMFSALGELFSTIIKPLLIKLKTAFMELLEKAGKAMKDHLSKHWEKYALGAAMIIVPGLVTAVLSFGKGLVMMAIGKLFMGDDGGTSLFAKIATKLKDGLGTVGTKLKSGIGVVGRAGAKAFEKVAPNMYSKVAGVTARLAPKFAGLGARLIPGVGIAATVMLAGKDINAAVDRLDGDLTKKFGETEGKLGAGAAGIANALTLGLLPPDMIDKIGNWTAGVAKKMNTFMDDIGLGGVSRALQAFVRLVTDTVGGVYDIIAGIFTGDSDQVAKGLQRIFDGVMGLVKKLPGAILDLVALLGKAVLGLFKGAFMVLFVYLPKAALAIVRGIGAAIAGLAKFIFKGFKALFKDIKASGGFGTWLWEKITGIAKAAWEGFKKIFSGAWTYFKEWAAGLVQSIWEGWGGEGDVMEPVTRFFDAIEYAAEAVVDAVVDFFKGIGKALKAIWDGIIKGAKWLWKGLKKGFNTLVDIIKWPFEEGWKIIKGVWKFISDGAKNVWCGIKETFTVMGEWFGEQVDKVKCVFSGLWTKVKTLASDAWTGIKDTFNGIKAWFNQKIIDVILVFQDLKKRIGEIAQKAWCMLTAPFRAAARLGSDIVDGIADGLGGLKDAILGIVKGAWKSVKSFFGISSPSKEGKAAGGFISDGLSDGFAEVEGKIKGTAENALKAIHQVFSGDNVVMMLKPVISAFVDAFTFIYTSIGAIFKMGILPPDIVDTTIAALKSVAMALSQALKALMPLIMHAASEILTNGMNKLLTDLGQSVRTGMISLVEMMSQSFSQLGQALMSSANTGIGVLEIMTKMTERLTTAMQKLNKAAPEKNRGLYDSVAAVVHNIETLGGVLTGDASDGAVKVVEAFKSGKMTVQHNLPNTKVEVVVHLDKKTLGNELVKTTLTGKQRIATTTG
jgi:sorbitol-specific phosphotransferase system component IIC